MAYKPRKTGKGCRSAGAVLGAKQGRNKVGRASRAGKTLEACKRNKKAGMIRLLPKAKPKKKIKLLPKKKKKIKLNKK